MPDVSLTPTAIAWDAFVAGHSGGHILQTSRWARLKCAFGWSGELALVRVPGRAGTPTEVGGDTIPAVYAGTIAAGASLLFRRLPWGQTLAYAPKGPVVDWADPPLVQALLAEMRRICRKRRAALLKIEPDLASSPDVNRILGAYGFTPSGQHVQPLSTIHLDLTADDDALLARMKPKWRYNIRLAARKGVQVRQGTSQDLLRIQALMETTGKRDGFAIHSPDYYALATQLFVPAGLASWLVAEHEGQALAAIAVFALGRKAWYMWGASGEEGRNLMPNHALQWAAIRWAREHGCAVYDLWGIPAEAGEASAPPVSEETGADAGLWGVYRFKQGFGGQVVRYTGAWDQPFSPTGHRLYRLALRLRARRG